MLWLNNSDIKNESWNDQADTLQQYIELEYALITILSDSWHWKWQHYNAFKNW